MKYFYKDYKAAALAPNASQDDIEDLHEWFDINGYDYWNGECYEIDSCHGLFPVYRYDSQQQKCFYLRAEIRSI